MAKSHYAACPTSTVATATCRCSEIEDAQIAAASRPSAAEMIRRAKAQGILTPQHAYN